MLKITFKLRNNNGNKSIFATTLKTKLLLCIRENVKLLNMILEACCLKTKKVNLHVNNPSEKPSIKNKRLTKTKQQP